MNTLSAFVLGLFIAFAAVGVYAGLLHATCINNDMSPEECQEWRAEAED